ncbi:COR domain-containing protein [Paractinoplanes lichenicola]|uniref:non-specific serine/threonine protein kinase n=1 Tax=Paractinoplanes lichenicola TaxID=2802976 RepID=A0ABS1W1Q3_9ACTN|nr:COR domain-containing protein [Actinoplanes lichenicola]MBL7260622.1 TIR domain-containing protein [Actinoplanes lichenicola]
MAPWWQSSDGSSGLTSLEEADLEAVENGRSESLELDLLLGLARAHGVDKTVHHLSRISKLTSNDGDSASREMIEIPEWIGRLPRLTYVDARGYVPTSLPLGLPLRWGLDADAVLHFARELDLSSLDAVSVSGGTTDAALNHLLRLAELDGLTLTSLTVSEILYGSWSENQASRWGCLSWLRANIDRLLAALPGLSSLVLFGCPLRRVPGPITAMTGLTSLTLSGLWPDTWPDDIFGLPSLTVLSLAFNDLTALPASLGRAQGLTSLDLDSNELDRIPDVVWSLTSLAELTVRRCPLKEISSGILRLENLSRLVFEYEFMPTGAGSVPDTLVVPPPEVAQRGLKAIKNYWLQERQAGVDYLAEAKLLVIGEAGAGKTTLTKKILDPSYRLDADENSTEGIDVQTWSFPSAIRVRDSGRLLQRDFRVNVWDFGGQEIYHATHQFFLTKRSVYVLVCDERKEDTDFHYWLDVVNLLSGGSPLIIVQNRKQGRAQALNLASLRQAYGNLCGTVSLNLADNEGLAEAVDRIRKEVESLPHIGTSLPKTWRDVRVALEADERDYISDEEFFRICRANGFTRDDDIRQLGGFLHDLGICLYFQDDALLRKTVILKPEWGTSAVYRVLDDDRVIDNLGVFGPGDLLRIWHEHKFAGMHAELVQLMVKFALCFQVERKYVAPQLLSPQQPEHDWDDTGNLVLRYEYDVMPKGIVRRLIVALHDLIEGSLVWRTGVVLKHESGRAEIIEEYHRRRLRIRLMGADPRVLLAMINRELGLIHGSYPEIRFDKLRPCHCDVCRASPEPAMFKISVLEDFARTGHLIQCRVSRELLDPVPMLAELSAEPVRRHASLAVAPVTPEVFVSYKWGGEAEAIVDDVQARLSALGVTVIRDKTEMSYRDSIRDFMRRIGAGKAIVVVLDKGYLESENCMFELTTIAAQPEFADRVFPIVLSDAGIFQPVSRLKYIAYWERRKAELEEAMRAVGQENLHGFRESLDLYEEIRNTIAGILNVLGDMNTLTPEMHRDEDFERLHQALRERLDLE